LSSGILYIKILKKLATNLVGHFLELTVLGSKVAPYRKLLSKLEGALFTDTKKVSINFWNEKASMLRVS